MRTSSRDVDSISNSLEKSKGDYTILRFKLSQVWRAKIEPLAMYGILFCAIEDGFDEFTDSISIFSFENMP